MKNLSGLKEERPMKRVLLTGTALIVAATLLFFPVIAKAREHGKMDKAVYTQSAVELKLAMRDLWIGHIFWVRNVVLETKYGDTEAANVAESKVVEDARAIGDAIVPIYGKDAGDKLFSLLAGHYGAIKEYMTATYGDDAKAQAAAVDKLTKNAEEIAAFLNSANPKNWPKDTLVSLLMAHGGHHMAQIRQINSKDFAGEAKTWDDMKKHIYVIADALSEGIVKQFPKKFVK
jgi:hypothetical protein